ncbi:MAG: hypothetical protein R2711_03305 [Acidimicrobiales bacterium]
MSASTIDDEIRDLLERAGVTANLELARSIVGTALALGTDGTERLDLKITASALAEMRRRSGCSRPSPIGRRSRSSDRPARSPTTRCTPRPGRSPPPSPPRGGWS